MTRLLPGLAGNRLGRVPQRVIAGQKTIADDFQRDEQDGENGRHPNGQRNVRFTFCEAWRSLKRLERARQCAPASAGREFLNEFAL